MQRGNFRSGNYTISRLRRKLYYNNPIIKKLGIIIFAAIFIFLLYSFIPPMSRFLGSILSGPRIVFSLITNSGAELRSTDGRTNILLLGMRGGDDTKNGGRLTDTMILVSVDQKSGDTVMISIPRDIRVDNLPEEPKKINQTYEVGEGKKKGGGLVFSEAVISQLFDIPIHYGVRVDFSGFVKAVDTVGGIDVNVERTFDDYEYPIEGKEEYTCGFKESEVSKLSPKELSCRFKHVHFDAGMQHMDGKRALEFVRSRYAEGDEGTDFARSKRQQKVIAAFKNKSLSLKTILDLGKVKELMQTFNESVDTDLDISQLSSIKNVITKIDSSKIRTVVLDEGSEDKPGLLFHPSDYIYGSWVLIPRKKDWSEIQDVVKKTLNEVPRSTK